LEGESGLPWDQGLYSFQLYPSGIPSKQDYLRSSRSKLYAHLLQFSAEWTRAPSPDPSASSFLTVATSLLEVSNPHYARLWNRQWEYVFHIASLRYFQHHFTNHQGRGESEGQERLHVLDAGAGFGFFPHYLAANLEGWSVTGMDNDAAVMAGYRAMKLEPPHSALEMHEGSMTDMLLADNSFDAVLAISVLHELDWKEKGISEMRRVLRPGGVLSVSLTIAHCSSCTSDEGHHSLGGAHNLLRIIQEFGFEEVRSCAATMSIFVFISWGCAPRICSTPGD